MWFFSFYRLYITIGIGAAVYVFLYRQWWVWPIATIVARVVWLGIERTIYRMHINRDFSRHISDFKQQFGPYGIRLANKANSDIRIKKSLSEIFTSDVKRLKKTVEQLEVMDALFSAGMRPEGDEYLLHDCKLKYGKKRLEKTHSPHNKIGR